MATITIGQRCISLSGRASSTAFKTAVPVVFRSGTAAAGASPSTSPFAATPALAGNFVGQSSASSSSSSSTSSTSRNFRAFSSAGPPASTSHKSQRATFSSAAAAAQRGTEADVGSTAGGTGDVGSSVGEPSKVRPAYLDYQATTPVDPRVLDAMLPYLTGRFGNPHSRSHAYGWDAEAASEHAREQIAALIGARPGKKEIIFTSGATESNNLAIKGAAAYLGSAKKKRHIITTEIEHKCVLASCIELSKLPVDPWEVTYLPVSKNGLLDLEQLRAAIRPDTGIVSVMHVNNEIGVMQDLAAIGRICREHDVLFHTDAAQAIGKVPIDVDAMHIDLLSISGHKVYGPKGIGALYVRKGAPRRVRLRPIIDGGGQEFGTRSGTLPPHLCVGLGAACELAAAEMERDKKHVEELANYMHNRLLKQLDAVELNGDLKQRYPGNLNLSFACVEGESLLMSLSKAISVSSGSACTSASLEPSYVLRALGVSEDLAHTSLRFGLGRFTTRKEVDEAVDAIVEAVTKLRDMSPLWELHQEGAGVNVQWG